MNTIARLVKTILAVAPGLVLIANGPSAFAGPGRRGQGVMTVSPSSVNISTLSNFAFDFRGSKTVFDPGSQATLMIPAGWSAPQTNSASGPGYVEVLPVQSGSIATLGGIAGSGPWTITVNFSTTKKQGGFTLNYRAVTTPSIAGVYRFTAQSRQAGGTLLRNLKSGSPTVTVNSPGKANTGTSVTASINPYTYGQFVTFSALVTGSGSATPTGTVTFRDGDIVLGTVALGTSGDAQFSTNRLSVPDSPSSITAEYSGDTNFNGSVSAAWLEDVNPAPLTFSGLSVMPKPYDAAVAASLDTNGVVFLGVVPGDDVALDTTLATAVFADANVGTQKTVAVSGLALAGNDGDNYFADTTASAAGDILPAVLTVTADNTNRAFGAPNPAFTASYSGFMAGENTSVLSGAPQFSTTADQNSAVAGGPYVISVSAGTLAATNYTFQFAPGLLTITSGIQQPPSILAIRRLSDGSIQLDCAGNGGEDYLVQAASDLASNSWTTVDTIRMDVNGMKTWTDSGATNSSSRFYRTAK